MTKISDLTELLGAGVDQANDLLTIVDMSEAGAARNKKIKITQLLGLVTDIAGLLDLKGSTDCSANPNYPAASKGDAYVVSVAGKIGGGSGKVVNAGDVYFATADNAGGTEASVGTSWSVIEGNLGFTPVNKAGDTMTGDLIVPDEAYDATAWNGSLEVPTKNAVRDKIESMSAGTLSDGDYGDITVSGSGTVMNIDADTVGPTELAATAVTPGSYTNTNLTVDQEGRITAASNGSAGSAALVVLGSDSSVSSGILEVTGLTLTDYCEVIVVLEDITFSAAGAPTLTCYISGSEVTTGYYYGHRSISSGANTESQGGSNVAAVTLLDTTTSGPWYPATGADDCFGGEVTFITPTSSNHKVFRFWGISSNGSTGATVDTDGGGALRNTGSIDGFKLNSGGTISAGRMVVLGRKRA